MYCCSFVDTYLGSLEFNLGGTLSLNASMKTCFNLEIKVIAKLPFDN